MSAKSFKLKRLHYEQYKDDEEDWKLVTGEDPMKNVKLVDPFAYLEPPLKEDVDYKYRVGDSFTYGLYNYEQQ